MKCPCGGALMLREWGSYTDETPIDEDGNIVREDRFSLDYERRGYEVECRECGLTLSATIYDDRIVLDD